MEDSGHYCRVAAAIANTIEVQKRLISCLRLQRKD